MSGTHDRVSYIHRQYYNIIDGHYRYLMGLLAMHRPVSPCIISNGLPGNTCTQYALVSLSPSLHLSTWAERLQSHPYGQFVIYIMEGLTGGRVSGRFQLHHGRVPPRQSEHDLCQEKHAVLDAFLKEEMAQGRVIELAGSGRFPESRDGTR